MKFQSRGEWLNKKKKKEKTMKSIQRQRNLAATQYGQSKMLYAILAAQANDQGAYCRYLLIRSYISFAIQH